MGLIYTHHGIDIRKYPAILNHLKQFKAALERRATIDHHKWYELQQPQFAYSASFAKTKIMYPHFSLYPNFSIVEPGFWGNDKTYTIPAEDYYLLAVLNSPIAWFFLNGICAVKAGGFRELRVIYMDQLPIPHASPTNKGAIVSLTK